MDSINTSKPISTSHHPPSAHLNREMQSSAIAISSTTNLTAAGASAMKHSTANLPSAAAHGPPNSIFINAGQYASSGGSMMQMSSNNLHHIPTRPNGASTAMHVQQPVSNTFINRGHSQQSTHQQPISQNNNNMSQQQLQQQQYKTAKTQMYEQMIIQQANNNAATSQVKQLQYANSGNSAGNSFTQTQLAAQQALTSQQHFLTSQSFNGGVPPSSTHGMSVPQPASLLFPRIGNVRNEAAATSGNIYKTSTTNSQNLAIPSQQQQHMMSQLAFNGQTNVQSPFLMNKKGNVTAGNVAALNGANKKTVSPRNTSTGFPQNQVFQMVDKNQQEEYTVNLLDSSDSKNRNRLKSNHYNGKKDSGKPEEFGETNLLSGGGKPNYNTEKFGQHLLVNSDSHTAIAAAKLTGDDLLHSQGALLNQNQFYVGEMSINGDMKRMTSEDAANLYQQTMTPSIMSSHSNKRQSHHMQMYKENHQAVMIQQQIQQQQIQSGLDQQQNQPLTHNFFSRRTVSNKDATGTFKQPHSQPVNGNNLYLLQNGGITDSTANSQFTATTNYPFSPTTAGVVNNANPPQPNQYRGMIVEGSQSSTAVNDPRMKFAGSVAGMRASHDNSPMKALPFQGGATNNAGGASLPTDSIVDSNNGGANGAVATANGDGQQQVVKIPVICGFHKRVLLLTSQIQSQGGTQQGFPIPGGVGGTANQAQATRDSINKKIRNRNPNCNHNNNSVFYAPCYNNVKYDDSYKKKEEVLRKVFFKECAREDEKRNFSQQPLYPNTYLPQGNQQKSNDPFTYLKPIENFLISTLFVDYDIQQAAKLNPAIALQPRPSVTGSSLFMELGLEQAIVAHKAFLLALIQSGKITNENMLKVLHEFKSSATEFDHECIYCKYSQYALRESTKVIRNNLKAQAEANGTFESFNQVLLSATPHTNLYMTTLESGLTQDMRIEYLIRMFQSQLFKRSFINTSLMIIQRKMNEKLLQKQRLPPGITQGQQPGGVADPNGKVKNLAKNDKKPVVPMSSLDWLVTQIQKLAKNLSNPKDKDKYLELKEKYYREFLMKINRSNNAIIPFPKTTFTPYKYYIGKGNNSILVRNCLKARFWWSMGDFEEWDEYNFIWTQWKSNKIIAKIKSNKDVQDAEAAANNTKSGLSIKEGGSDSILSTDRDSNSSAETLLATPTKRKRVATALQTTQQSTTLPIKKTTSASKSTVGGKPGIAPPVAPQDGSAKSKKETSHGVITYNHMENNFHLSNKKALYYNMKIYYDAIGQDWSSVLPLTFHIKEGAGDKEYQRFIEMYKDLESGKGDVKFDKLGKQIWIVKPGENTNRGCGIQVCRELSQIKEIISNTNVNGQKRSYIIQKYIERPLLYKNRKFDIRCYTLMTTVNGNMQGYWYTDGYLRTSSKDFNLKNVTNRLIHLTNDAVQKKSDDYGKFESGNKLSYPEFQKYLDSIDIKCNIIKEIVPQLKKMTADTIKACSRKVDPHRRHNTFEIFGYDFMIDEDLKPWLIEVNTNPCLELSAPYLSRLIPAMVENAVKIAVDPLFPPPPWPNAKKHMIPDCIDNNKFELVFNELTDGAELKALPIDDLALNGIIEEEEMEEEGSDNDDGDEYIA